MDTITTLQIIIGFMSSLAVICAGYVTLKLKPMQNDIDRMIADKKDTSDKLDGLINMTSMNHTEQIREINKIYTWTRDQDYTTTEEMEKYVKDQVELVETRVTAKINSRHG